ncbi:3-hydroxyacyl-CoA dehydrogenase family protein [Allopusillimonas ginsengisoli]|uniref:3-hydroxyacyl-CoA dehydrogenase family protein n=1 Tax=Allopusillimonas ginsengisoli TaxID=453575 RepID=UPI0039C1045E
MKHTNCAHTRVSILGGGLMGHGIAQVFMTAGFDVSIWDPASSVRESISSRIAEHLAEMGDDRLINIRICDNLSECVAFSELVVEAAPEKLAIKRDLIREIESHNDSCIIATNTSVLRITEIAAASARPERVVGTHWWNPPYLMPLVEVVRGEKTSEETARQTSAWLERAGKTPVDIYRDVPGFVGNRMQFALVREAAHIVEEGICSPETVDLVARLTFGRRLSAIGPLQNADFIGLDLTSDIMNYLMPFLSDSKEAPQLFQRSLVKRNFGAKSGKGIFEWKDSDQANIEKRLVQHLMQIDANDRESQG